MSYDSKVHTMEYVAERIIVMPISYYNRLSYSYSYVCRKDCCCLKIGNVTFWIIYVSDKMLLSMEYHNIKISNSHYWRMATRTFATLFNIQNPLYLSYTVKCSAMTKINNQNLLKFNMLFEMPFWFKKKNKSRWNSNWLCDMAKRSAYSYSAIRLQSISNEWSFMQLQINVHFTLHLALSGRKWAAPFFS